VKETAAMKPKKALPPNIFSRCRAAGQFPVFKHHRPEEDEGAGKSNRKPSRR